MLKCRKVQTFTKLLHNDRRVCLWQKENIWTAVDAQYVDRVRNYVKEMELDVAVSRAVAECIEEGILTEFLRKNRAEVEKVSIFEYDKEEEERKLRKAEYEAGRCEGRQDGAKALIVMARKHHLKDDEILKILCQELELDVKVAKELLEKNKI